MSISANVFMPARFNEMIETQKKNSGVPRPPIDDDEETLLAAFVQAKEEYVDKVLRGLNAYSQEDLDEKLQNWIKFNHPGENATPEELEKFFRAKSGFAFMLQELAASQGNKELLITTSGQDEDEPAQLQGFLQSKLPSNPDLQSKLLG